MTVCSLLLAACLTAGPQVEVQGLSGKTHTGSLAAIDAETVRIESEDSGAQELSVNELRSLRFVDVAPTDEFAEPPAVEVWLVDGTRLAGSDIRLTVDKCTAQVEAIGEVTLPRDTVLAVRLAAATGVQTRWDELRERETAADMLVVRREQSLDFVEGGVGEITESEITFLLKDQTRTLPRDRAFGIVFASSAHQAGRPNLQVEAGRSRLELSELILADGAFTATMACGVKVPLPPGDVRLVEFSGRVRPLGDLQAAVELPQGTSPQEQFRFFRRGTEPFGAALRIGADERITSEGLWIHSGVVARYRINRDYRRLQAMAGMDHNVGGNRSVQLVIQGDGKPLFDDVIRWSEPARDLDLDVTGQFPQPRDRRGH